MRNLLKKSWKERANDAFAGYGCMPHDRMKQKIIFPL